MRTPVPRAHHVELPSGFDIDWADFPGQGTPRAAAKWAWETRSTEPERARTGGRFVVAVWSKGQRRYRILDYGYESLPDAEGASCVVNRALGWGVKGWQPWHQAFPIAVDAIPSRMDGSGGPR